MPGGADDHDMGAGIEGIHVHLMTGTRNIGTACTCKMESLPTEICQTVCYGQHDVVKKIECTLCLVLIQVTQSTD